MISRPAPIRDQFLHIAVLVVGIAGGFVANAYGWPVTAALSFVFAVVLVATRYGLKSGLVAGVLASIAYNLLLSDPFLRFGLTSIDDVVPLLAFNVSAVACAYVAGRLKDQARASEDAQLRVESLLTFSQELQTTSSLHDMVVAAHQSAPGPEALELHLDDGRIISPEQEPALHLLAAQLRNMNCTSLPFDKGRMVLCERFSDGLVVAVVEQDHATDAAAHLAIIALAAERWALTHRLVQADVLRQSEQFKTALLSSVSHDFRTPLSVISASAGSLLRYRETLTAEAQQDLLKSIEQQSRRLDQLTGNLLSLGRIEGGLDTASMPTIDALDVLGEVLVAVREKAPARAITKAYGVREALVRTDPSLLHQIVANVLENAVVHTPENTGIHVSVDRTGGMLLIRVDDEGPGVDEVEAEEIFERLRQGAAAQARRQGAGLGLSIARGFARSLDGDVDVANRPDGRPGARFEIRLPLKDQGR